MTDLTDAVALIRTFVHDRGWALFHDPKNLAMAVASEAGELVGELRWTPSEQADEVAKEPGLHARLSAEAADVAITLLMFCDRAGIDLTAAIPKKLEQNAVRYPVSLPFEPAGLELMPWSARRALDHAGLRISLTEWQGLPMEIRRRLAGAGSLRDVPKEQVRSWIDGDPIAPFVPPREPPDALSIDTETWSRLSVVAQHALHAYAARGKLKRLGEAYSALSCSR